MEAAAASKGMSYAHFRRKFREIIGQSPYQYLAGQRIGHACRLLTMTSLSIKEIAASSGFDYTESFNRLFRQYMNQSPKSYRNSQYARAPKSSEE
jgi:transcriptional regulator GlxA family with amidase domain